MGIKRVIIDNIPYINFILFIINTLLFFLIYPAEIGLVWSELV